MESIDRKKFLKHTGAIALGSTLGGSLISPRSTSAATARERISLKFASWGWSEPGTKDVFALLVRRFEQANPNIKIEPVNIPYPSYQSTLIVQMSGGSAPDIVGSADNFVKQWILQGYFAPLDPLLPMGQYKGKLLPAVDMARYKGQYYAMNWTSLTYAIIYNSAIFAKAGIKALPRTPTEFLDVAMRTTKAPQQYGYAARTTTDQEAGWWYDLANWIYGFGGRWSRNGRPTINDPNNVRAVEFYKKLYDSGVMPKGTDAATYRRLFWEGRIAMLIDNSVNIGIFKAENPSFYPKISAAPTPFANRAAAYEATFLSVSSGSKHPKEAASFIHFVLRPDNLVTLLKATDSMQGPYKGNVLGPIFVRDNPWAQAFVKDVGIPVEPAGMEQYTSQITKLVLDRVEQSLIGGVPVKQALDDAQQAVHGIVPH